MTDLELLTPSSTGVVATPGKEKPGKQLVIGKVRSSPYENTPLDVDVIIAEADQAGLKVVDHRMTQFDPRVIIVDP